MRRFALALTLLALVVPAARADDVSRGRALFAQGCVSCHGPTADGIANRGPSLHGVGARAAHFYLTTGYMPLRDPFQQPERQDPAYSPDDVRALVAYVGSLGGPPVPRPHPEQGSIRDGLKLFTAHCAGCHQIGAAGGYVPGGVAVALDDATATQIAEAVRIGPYLMPRFPPQTISDRDLDSIIAYVGLTKDPVDRGGWPIGHIGPVTEGLVAWLIAGSALVLLVLVIGERAKRE